jgi:hypothetical protein
MAKRDVKGLHTVRARGREYTYAWRGGPRIHGEPGTPQFWAALDAINRERHIPELGKFRALVTLYRASADYAKLADSTKAHW